MLEGAITNCKNDARRAINILKTKTIENCTANATIEKRI
jgi:hypothetical protein